jgi:WD40 repeat protein
MMQNMDLNAPPPALASLTEHVIPLQAGAHVSAIGWIGQTVLLALGDGHVLVVRDGETQRVAAHPGGAVLSAASNGNLFVTGGDDGRVVTISAAGEMEILAHEKGWIDALALARGAVAWSSGRNVTARDEKGRVKHFAAPSSARGLAFLPKGYRLAVSHYNGASLWFPNVEAEPEALAWKGSHLDVTASPDGRFVVTSMQENALHGWRLADKKDMRMTGYPGKTRSFSWSHDGQWLATSGADAAIVWPFAAKDGPMGKAPRECGVRPARVARVAFHPHVLILALGYEDGMVMLVRLNDAAELLVRKPGEGAVTALGWDGKGKRLAFGTEEGAAGVLTLPA